ncbi:SDR family NAD(P)-dependent oxidoreductase [Streptomyces sp. NPDC058405]|uniref:SDR family NAD(P)-dependent oxidoreductase n=2 Tax=Streptomyces TaxID=1883 RepID=UPI003654B9BF
MRQGSQDEGTRMTTSVIIGGSSGLGRHMAECFAARGEDVVIGSRDGARAEEVATQIGDTVSGIGVDLSSPDTIEDALRGLGGVDHLVITVAEPSLNSLAAFSVESAARSATIKLVGYTETVRVLKERFRPGASVVLFGGLAKERPYPGSTVVSAANAAVTGLTRTLALELAPVRVNALHPGVVGDSPRWRDVPDHPHLARTPIGRLVTMAEITHAADFLLHNGGINAIDLYVDGGLRVG